MEQYGINFGYEAIPAHRFQLPEKIRVDGVTLYLKGIARSESAANEMKVQADNGKRKIVIRAFLGSFFGIYIY